MRELFCVMLRKRFEIAHTHTRRPPWEDSLPSRGPPEGEYSNEAHNSASRSDVISPSRQCAASLRVMAFRLAPFSQTCRTSTLPWGCCNIKVHSHFTSSFRVRVALTKIDKRVVNARNGFAFVLRSVFPLFQALFRASHPLHYRTQKKNNFFHPTSVDSTLFSFNGLPTSTPQLRFEVDDSPTPLHRHHQLVD